MKIRSIGDWTHGWAPFNDSAPNYTLGVLIDVEYGATYLHYWIFTDACIIPPEHRAITLEEVLH